MARLAPFVIADENKCINCKDRAAICPCEVIRLAPVVAESPVVEIVDLKGRQFGNKCDFCFCRNQGLNCIEACPEKALCLVDPLKDKIEKNIKAARSIAGIRRNGY